MFAPSSAPSISARSARLANVDAELLGGRQSARPAVGVGAEHVAWDGSREHLAALLGQERRGTQPDGPHALDHRAASVQVAILRDHGDGGGRRRVAAVGVEHRRHAERAEVGGLHLVENLLARAHVRAPDPHRQRGVARPAREERSLDEITHGLRRDAPVAEQDVDARVVSHDGVEGARMLVGVEL